MLVKTAAALLNYAAKRKVQIKSRGRVGAFGGIWTRDHYLTKARTQRGIGTINWAEFKEFVYSKYAKSTAPKVMSYAKRYSYLLESGNLGQINSIALTVRSDVIKSLIIISKYAGCYEDFKAGMKSYGIKLSRPDAFAAFIRIYNNHNADLGDWISQVKPILRPEENLLLRFLRSTGLRLGEGMLSFNLIISLSNKAS